MAGVTENGFETKTYQEVFDENTETANSDEYFGADFPTTVDSAFGILNAIFSAALKDSGWDQAEAVYNQFNRDKAEGKNLEDLAALVGLEREAETSSTGKLFFIGTAASPIPKNLSVTDNDGQVVLTTDSYTYERTACYYVEIAVASIEAETDYKIIIDGDSYTYTSDTESFVTKATIIAGLNAGIGSTGDATSSIDSTSLKLYITRDSTNNGMSVTVGSNLSINYIGLIAEAEAEEAGESNFSAGTLKKITTAGDAIGTKSVTNIDAFESGSEEETDEELRLRMANADDGSDSATVPSIQSALTGVANVTSVTVTENNTMYTDSSGRPAKSYECVVRGGSDSDIGAVLWDTKPAGMTTYGNTSVIVTDNNDDEQVVYFSRATSVYASVLITYTLYDEEEFPENGEDTMIATIVSYGDSLAAGDDIIPARFKGQIYSAVDGIDELTVQIGIASDATTTPVYQTTRISISDSETADFSADRITVSI